ncbi:MAG TPA: choice-of-anchor D domain-containing protein, partial [Bacteriovoracaceae bacterium]|nr:choice-of-anchor D domain-containing protein [Bacteriovoracaceae bacterium]
MGTLPKALVFRTTEKEFVLTNTGKAIALDITLSLAGDSEINFTGGSYPGTGGTCGGALDRGHTCTVNVTFAPLTKRTFNTNLNVKYRDEFANREIDIPLIAVAKDPAKLVFNVASHDFGPIAYEGFSNLSGTGRLTLTVTNIGEWIATDLNYVNPSPPYYLVSNTCTDPIDENQSCAIQFEFRPPALATYNYNVLGPAPADSYSINMNYNNGMVVSPANNSNIITTFNGIGVLPALLALTPVPDPFNMSWVIVGLNKTSTYTVTNSGDVPAVIDLLNTNGSLVSPFAFQGMSYPGLTGTCVNTNASGNFVVLPGEVCNIAITATPLAQGIFNDNVDLAYDNGINARLESQGLQVEGIIPAILEISGPAIYDYGTLHRNEPAYATFTVTNVGQSPASLITDITLAAPFSYQGGYPGTDGVTPGTCTANMAAAPASCTVVVKIMPTAYGVPLDDMQIDYFNSVFNTNVTKSLTALVLQPTVTATTPLPNTYINIANQNSYTVAGACSENTRNVDIQLGAISTSIACAGLAYTTNINASGLAEGAMALTVDHIDAFANSANTASVSGIIKDAIAPIVAFTSTPIINNANKAAYTVTGTCTENTRVVTVNVGGLTTTPTCTGLAWTTTLNVTTLADNAAVSITIDQVDAANNPSIQGATTVLKDTVNPTVSILSTPVINNANKNSYTASGACSENGRTVSVSIGGVLATPNCVGLAWTTGAIDVSAALDSTTLAVTADHVDFAGNPATQATASILKDTIDPTVAITSSPVINNANKAAYTVSGTCSENGRIVTVDVGGVAATPTCTAPSWTTTVNVTGIADSLALAISADHNDFAGNNAVQAATTVIKDTVDPLVAITSSPIINNANKAAYTVSGTCTENGRTVSVNIGGVLAAPVCGGGAWSTGAINVSAAADSLTLAITADHNDSSGNVAIQATQSVLKDTIDPTVGINAPAIINNANKLAYNVTGTCSESGQIVSINIGSISTTDTCAAGLTWTATVNISGDPDGPAVAISADHDDVAGNSAVQATATILKDTVDPTVTISSVPVINNANKAAYTIGGNCSENTRTVTVDVGGVAGSGTCVAPNWTATLNVTSIADSLTVAITADHNDFAGNNAVQAAASVIKDTVDPTVTITSSPVINNANKNAYTVSGACSENGRTVNVDIGGVLATPSCIGVGWTTGPIDVSAALDSLTLAITADHDDFVGNIAIQATASVLKDTIDPTVAITSSPVINNANKAAYLISGTCSESTQIVSVDVGGVLATPSCIALGWSATLNVTGVADSLTVAVTADHVDVAGNPAIQATGSVVKDTVDPTVAITSSPIINNANKTAYTLGGTCSENGQIVSVNAGGVLATPSCIGLTWTTAPLNVSGAADSLVFAITADHIDVAGNNALQATTTIVKDTVDPTVSITSSPAINNANKAAYTVSGACSENTRTVNVNVGGVTGTPTCTSLAWTTTLNVTGVADSATVTITADHNDAAGNTATQATTSVLKDTVDPTVAITSSPVINNANKAAYTVSGTCSENTRTVSVDVGGVLGTPACTALAWTTTLNVTGVADSLTLAITADHTDAAANNAIQATTSVVKDTVDPTVTITSSTIINNANKAAYTVTGACSENTRTVSVTVGGVASAPTCTALAWTTT